MEIFTFKEFTFKEFTCKRLLLFIQIIAVFCLFTDSRAGELWELNLTYSFDASFDYGGEGNNYPPSYTAEYSGINQPLYSLELIRKISDSDRFGVSFMHGGSTQFDDDAVETVRDNSTEPAGIYQQNKLNAGFSNFMTTYYKKIADTDLEFMINFSVIRMMFSRKDFVIEGESVDEYLKNDNNVIAGEGFGFGIKGRSGDKLFLKYMTFANYYVEIEDMETDSELGQMFACELSTGYEFDRLTIEAGYMYRYLFMHSHTNRRLYLGEDAPGEGVIISWSQQDMTVQGAFVRLGYLFD